METITDPLGPAEDLREDAPDLTRPIPIPFTQVGCTEWRFGIEQPRALKDAPTLISLFLKDLGFVGGSFRARSRSRLDTSCCQP